MMTQPARLTCPKCAKVAQTAKPVPVGTRVQCPYCRHAFTVAAEVARTAAVAGKPAAGDEEEGGTYGYIADNEAGAPEISYAPDTSIRDLRGPATQILMRPSHYLLAASVAGAVGWLTVLVMVLVPAIFPLDDGSSKPKGPLIGAPGSRAYESAMSERSKKGSKLPPFLIIFGMNLGLTPKTPVSGFVAALLPLVLGACYSGVCTLGAVRMQNLQSRKWGMAGAIMAILPFNASGVMLVVALVIQFTLKSIELDGGFIDFVLMVFMAGVWLASVAAGAFAVYTLNRPEVVAGFEFVPE
jgi:hypothetical protein